MEHSFDYYYTMQPSDSFYVEDISNITLQINNDNADEWYIDVSTNLGSTTIQKFGPLTMDCDTIGNYFEYNYFKMQYNENKVIGFIDRILNNPKYLITQIMEIDRDDFRERLKNLKTEEDNEEVEEINGSCEENCD